MVLGRARHSARTTGLKQTRATVACRKARKRARHSARTTGLKRRREDGAVEGGAVRARHSARTTGLKHLAPSIGSQPWILIRARHSARTTGLKPDSRRGARTRRRSRTTLSPDNGIETLCAQSAAVAMVYARTTLSPDNGIETRPGISVIILRVPRARHSARTTGLKPLRIRLPSFRERRPRTTLSPDNGIETLRSPFPARRMTRAHDTQCEKRTIMSARIG